MVDLGNRPAWSLRTPEGIVFEGCGQHWSLRKEFHISSLVEMETAIVGCHDDEN